MTLTDPTVKVVDFRTNDDSGLVTTAFARPALSWRLRADRGSVVQQAYELQRARDREFTAGLVSSGPIDSTVPFGAGWIGNDLASREVAWCRVRIWTDLGLTQWSEPLRIEGSLFDQSDWTALPISPPSNVGQILPGPVPLLRRRWQADGEVASARLYRTSLGLNECWINGREVGDELLEPGWTTYHKRLLFCCHDVTRFLRSGENVLAAAVGDGWWRGNLTWIPRRAVYGDTTAFIAQLEIAYTDGRRETIPTGDGWTGSYGSVRRADIYDGCDIDLASEPVGWKEAGFDEAGWEAVAVLPAPAAKLEQRSAPPVRVIQSFRPETSQNDRLVRVDCGQNLSGFLQLEVNAKLGGTITVRHAEVLDADGGLFTAALRTAKATDTYTVPVGAHQLQPVFTYHGFRYAEIALPEGVELENVTVCVVASDLAETGSFACSDARLNQLASNIVWSQRGNFISLPTDCPQRDERLGWTGDIQVFAAAACLNFESRAFLASWLKDLLLEQAEDGQVPSTVPNVIQGHPYEFGGVGWADAATLVPWALYQAYGDRQVLQNQYQSMRAWVDFGISRLDSSGIWTGDFHLGDWLDPGAPPDRPEEATTSRDYIASCYLARSSRALAEAAAVLGLREDSRHYAQVSDKVAAATWKRWHTEAQTTQAGCALAIFFAIAPKDEVAAVGTRLAQLVAENRGRIATGFLGTPALLPALTAAGQFDAAWSLLLNPDVPGWLYQVRMGATTTWERWDAVQEDGSLNSGSMAGVDADNMTSFNHYAYGCVGEWLYSSVAGIRLASPGYELIEFAPVPGGELDYATASVRTPFGEAAIGWTQRADRLDVVLTIPPGSRARFRAPAGYVQAGPHEPLYGSGTHQIELTVAPSDCG